MTLIAIGTFLALAFVAYVAFFLTSNLTSIALVMAFIPPHGRCQVNALLFYFIWSSGINGPGLNLAHVVVALIIAGCCVGLFSTFWALVAAGAAASALAMITLIVVFKRNFCL